MRLLYHQRMDLILTLKLISSMIHICFVAEDERFEADKAQVVREIASLKLRELA